MGDGEIAGLPEGCISDIFSLTSPRDCCRSAAVSTTFRSTADSDTVWDCFLPSDLSDLLSRAVGTVNFTSKKDLYSRLCDGVLIDGSRMIFSLERSTGRRCYTLSARELKFVWGDTPRYWTWGSHQDSRFPVVAKLSCVCEIGGKIDCRILSQRTNYAAYLIFKLAEGSYNLINQKASVSMGGYVSESKVCLQPNDEDNILDEDDNDDEDDDDDDDDDEEPDNEDDTLEEEEDDTRVVGNHVAESEVRSQPNEEAASQEKEEEDDEEEEEEDDDDDDEEEVEETRMVGRAPRRRNDGWMEMELGEFFNVDGDDGDVEMCLKGKDGILWKDGLIVEGIEVRSM